jgi:hypothetical protein
LKTSAARSFAGFPCTQVERNTGPDSGADADAVFVSRAASAAAPAMDFMKSRRSIASIIPPFYERSQESEVRSQNAADYRKSKSETRKWKIENGSWPAMHLSNCQFRFSNFDFRVSVLSPDS